MRATRGVEIIGHGHRKSNFPLLSQRNTNASVPLRNSHDLQLTATLVLIALGLATPWAFGHLHFVACHFYCSMIILPFCFLLEWVGCLQFMVELQVSVVVSDADFLFLFPEAP